METGVVLTGGGARAAYQVGVLRAISDMYPDWENPFRVIVGTSAGALNAAALASGSPIFRHNVGHLEGLWSEISVDRIYKSQTLDILRNMRGVARGLFSRQSQSGGPMALLNNSPLKGMLEKELNFDAIGEAIREGRISAVGVNACGYSTGQNVCFFQGREGLKSWSVGQRAGARVDLGVSHVLASAAIPTVFPPVLIHREYFGDGVTRQMAHASPALRLGAQRLLVVGVSANSMCPTERPESPHSPTFAQVIAQVFNGMFLDTLDYDIERLRLINQLIELVPPGELEKSGLDLKPVKVLEISPSHQINDIAAKYMDGMPLVLRNLVGATDRRHGTAASLASYLLFDPRFCRELIRLGYQDAQDHARQIERFFKT
ncbi:NTE family protein [Marinobacter daqiaonensis]|uniref:NTE family protein n=1 Tax=Marinobacter daqiaonensis TaxID=650891 RepID=A0A1I6JBF8_9GAMM|nr:patatin-like phospholipase family protein [Marinobacter daqiaonensis]SFR76327.1 NTE family protein [Marinobacter daqiaonensis]